MEKHIKIAGFDVVLVKKAVKHLRITVSKGGVKVTAPVRLSAAEIETVVAQKSDWIAGQLARSALRLPELPDSYIGGESIRVWGKYYTVRFEFGGRIRLMLDGDVAVIRVKPDTDKRSREAAVTELLRREIKREVEKRLPLWEEATGLKSAAFGVRDMTSRWGTCNTQSGRLTFSVRLAQKPPECLDYIIVHELCHLAVPNHGQEFKALMDRFYPQWKKVRKELRT